MELKCRTIDSHSLNFANKECSVFFTTERGKIKVTAVQDSINAGHAAETAGTALVVVLAAHREQPTDVAHYVALTHYYRLNQRAHLRNTSCVK